MKLDRVTMTGPDDSIAPADLLPLSRRFPFVEWGILVSGSNAGVARFPSQEWITSLVHLTRANPGELKLCLHVCGRWVRELLLGNCQIPYWLLDPVFDRVQLNFHAERTICEKFVFHRILNQVAEQMEGVQFLFQIDGAHGNRHLESIYDTNERNPEYAVNAAPLFDISGGAGIVPDDWPQAAVWKVANPATEYFGYAGGLGPEVLADQLPLIAAAAGGARIWIDMETHIRSNADQLFDLAKVESCLQIAQPHISK